MRHPQGVLGSPILHDEMNGYCVTPPVSLFPGVLSGIMATFVVANRVLFRDRY